MSLSALTQSFPWGRYSKKLTDKILRPRNGGYFTREDADARGMRLAVGFEGSIPDGNGVQLYWLVDPDDGVIVDVKFQVMGQSALIGAAEAAAELLVGKNYDQASRLTSELIDRSVRDKSEIPAFPWETSEHLNLVLGAIDHAASLCSDIPVAASYVAPPAPIGGEKIPGGYPGWESLTMQDQQKIIEDLLDQEVRPYIALDGGGIQVVKWEVGNQLTIAYQGNCTSCLSSVGATLSYIQQTLRNKLSERISVIPSM